MNTAGKRNQQSSWWSASEKQSNWLSRLRKKQAVKTTGSAVAAESSSVKQARKSGL